MALRWLRRQWINFASLIVAIIGMVVTVYSLRRPTVMTPAQPTQQVQKEESPEPLMPPVVRASIPVRKLVAASTISPTSRGNEESIDLEYSGNPQLESLAVNYTGRKIDAAGCTRTTCYVVSDPGRFEPNRLELYRWPAAGGQPERFRATFPVDEAAFHKFSPYFEEAVVGWAHEGSGGYMELRILLWSDGAYHELSTELPQAAGMDGDFKFDDLDGDDIQELIVTYRRYEPKVEVFRFDDALLTFEKVDESSEVYLAAGGEEGETVDG